MRKDKLMEEQQKAAEKALSEVGNEGFWKAVGPDLENKLKLAGRYIFSKGAEFGAKKFASEILKDIEKPFEIKCGRDEHCPETTWEKDSNFYYDCGDHKKFKIGDIVRYATGPTALMKITEFGSYVSDTHGQRYYGIQYYGSAVGGFEKDMAFATKQEIKKFKTDTHLGRLRDYPELAK